MRPWFPAGLLLLAFATTLPAQQTSPRVQENIKRTKERLGEALLTTADAVIAGHLEAVGGEDAIRSIKTLMFRGRGVGFGAGDTGLYRYYKQPNFLRSTRSPEGTPYTVTDGERVWLVTPEGRRELTAWWAQSMKHHRIDGNFIDYKARGIEYEYIGLEGFETERSTYYHLRRKFPDGFVEDLYFDVDTGLLHGIWPTSSPRKDDPSFHYDYREVGGILTPHMWVRTFANASPPHILIIDEVRVNEEFSKGFFTEHMEKPIQE